MTQLKSEKYKPIHFELGRLNKVLKLRIGNVVRLTFLAVFLVLSVMHVVILFTINYMEKKTPATQDAQIKKAIATQPSSTIS